MPPPEPRNARTRPLPGTGSQSHAGGYAAVRSLQSATDRSDEPRLRVFGRVCVRLPRAAADGAGVPTPAARRHLWQTLTGLPSGCTVHLDLGPVTVLDHELAAYVAQLVGDGVLMIEGGNAAAVVAYVTAVRRAAA